MHRILVTGCGGIGGINFVNALRFAEALEPSPKFFLLGTDYNQYYIKLSSADLTSRSPRHDDPSFVPTIEKLVKENRIDFLHPNPSSEAKVLKQAIDNQLLDGVRTLIPDASAIAPTKDEMKMKLESTGVPTPNAIIIDSEEKIEMAFVQLGKPLWIRAKQGAGARLSLKVKDVEEATLWIDLCVKQGRARMDDFMAQPFLPGRDLAYDSLWFRGKLIASSSRHRLEYPLKHISLTGLTGTPSVARTISENEISQIGRRAVEGLDKNPNGFYSVDLKEDESGKAFVTEVDGKWHTTGALWGMSVAKCKKDNKFNIAYQYIKLGLGDESDLDGNTDLYGEGLCMIRQMDSGVVLIDEKSGNRWRIE